MEWKILLSTFGLLFLAELGDKTQLAVIAQTCKHGKPWMVFLGATLALAAVTALGVLCGRTLSACIPPATLHKLAAVAFVVMGLLMWFEVL
jgi:putative Ca2+/H+ antiporter (TMEM165/GDT1 family)